MREREGNAEKNASDAEIPSTQTGNRAVSHKAIIVVNNNTVHRTEQNRT